MELWVFRALWGMTGPLEMQLDAIAAAGYDGVEAWPPGLGPVTAAAFRRMVAERGLRLIVATALAETAELERALTDLAAFEPLRIGVQSGRDSMTTREGAAFIEEALRVEAALGIPVAHETHRGKLLFTPWTTARYLREYPTLTLVADYSHWVNVCERLPFDQAEAMTLANARALHIHGRIGYEEGPQVPDPAAPEYAAQRTWHEAQWRAIWLNQRAAGMSYATFTPEYGPPPYLHTLPYTQAPVNDLWQTCLWAADQARALFDEL
jgi:hypothetical protein